MIELIEWSQSRHSNPETGDWNQNTCSPRHENLENSAPWIWQVAWAKGRGGGGGGGKEQRRGE
jgi:hypothetical protein